MVSLKNLYYIGEFLVKVKNLKPSYHHEVLSTGRGILTNFWGCVFKKKNFFPKVGIRRDKVTWPGAKIQKTGEGMPNYDNNKQSGNLYIMVDVKFPRGSFAESREGELHPFSTSNL